jgi:AcrR family transcriptional regulator
MATPRERARERTLAEIRTLAWRHLEQEGAAALSLRAIARELGVVSSAIYRYVPSRDDLLTELIVEGYTDLAGRAAGADESARRAGAGPRERWLAIAAAMRAWALARPAAWSLLYGSPVPGYHAPAERTTPAGTGALLRLVTVVAEARSAGLLAPGAVDPRTVPDGLASDLTGAAATLGVPGAPEEVAGSIAAWTMIVATISSEIFGQLGGDTFTDPSSWAEVAFGVSADLAGLKS